MRHMVEKPIEDRYSQWEDNKLHTELDNLIQDILKGQLDEKYWEVMPATKSTKRKSHVNPPCVLDTMDVGPYIKRKKDTEHVNGCHTSETVCSYHFE